MERSTIEIIHASTTEILVPELESFPLVPKDGDLIHVTRLGIRVAYTVTTSVPHYIVDATGISTKLVLYVLPIPSSVV